MGVLVPRSELGWLGAAGLGKLRGASGVSEGKPGSVERVRPPGHPAGLPAHTVSTAARQPGRQARVREGGASARAQTRTWAVRGAAFPGPCFRYPGSVLAFPGPCLIFWLFTASRRPSCSEPLVVTVISEGCCHCP